MNRASVYEPVESRCGFRRQFWKENKWPVDWPEIEGDCLKDPSKATVILVDPKESDVWLKRLKKFSQEIDRTGFVDSIWSQERKFWPKSVYAKVLKEMIVQVGKRLDTRDLAYVTGSGPWACLSVAAVFDLGYRRIRLICNDQVAVTAIAERVRKFCFGIEIEGLLTSDVTLQPNNGTLLLNTVDLTADSDMLQTLLYLNFIHKPGLIMDLPFNYQPSALLQEASNNGFEVVAGLDFRGVYDAHLLKLLGIDLGRDLTAYLKSWQDFFEFLR